MNTENENKADQETNVKIETVSYLNVSSFNELIEPLNEKASDLWYALKNILEQEVDLENPQIEVFIEKRCRKAYNLAHSLMHEIDLIDKTTKY